MDVEMLRKSYLPSKIKVLFIAEAKPDADDRFFYYDKVTIDDYLYIYLMRALYGYGKQDTALLRANKQAMLNKFMKDGYYLVDAVDEIKVRTEPAVRVKAIRANADIKVSEMELLVSQHGTEDTKVVIIAATVFKGLYEHLKDKFNVVNDTPIYFPNNGRQNEFLGQMAQILPEIT